MLIIASRKDRVDKLVAEALPKYSRAALSKLFKMSCVTVDGILVTEVGFRAKDGSKIEVDLTPLTAEQQVVELPIIFEDNNVIVIDKPSGIISHSRGKFWYEPSVASFVRTKISNISGDRAGIVHRLDRATSGVMICAKNQESLSFLQKQFHDRKVQKTYVAIVSNTAKEEEAIIDAAIGRDPKTPKMFKIDVHGKSAQTHYKVIASNGQYSKLLLEPKTGRTHQLRVHLSYIGCPIVGDELYRGEKNDRLLLHASSLEITLPDGKRTIFNSELPKEFSTIMKSK